MEKWMDEAFERACAKFERGAKQAAAQGIIPYMGEKGRYSIRFGYRDRGKVWGVLEAFMDIAAGTVGGR